WKMNEDGNGNGSEIDENASGFVYY
ncbi:unnamed protein product, partial [Didymodactylos carnosus]